MFQVASLNSRLVLTWVQDTFGAGCPDTLQNKLIVWPFVTVKSFKGPIDAGTGKKRNANIKMRNTVRVSLMFFKKWVCLPFVIAGGQIAYTSVIKSWNFGKMWKRTDSKRENKYKVISHLNFESFWIKRKAFRKHCVHPPHSLEQLTWNSAFL